MLFCCFALAGCGSSSTSPKDGGSISPKDADSTSPKDADSTSPKDADSTSPKDADSTSPKDFESTPPEEENPCPKLIAGELALSFGKIKTLSFCWQDKPDATYYQLLEDPDGQSGYTQVGKDIKPNIQAVDHIVPLYARVNARYLLKSCNVSGCSESASVHISECLSDMTASIGYLKGNVMANIHSVSLSADGDTLAVGAPYEMSSAKGINSGDSAGGNYDSPFSGAVYVFTRTEIGWSQQAYIKASNAGKNDYFGYDVSLSADGDTLAVGAKGEASDATGINGGDSAEGNNTAPGSGAAYVFTRAATVWSQQAYIKPGNTGMFDAFGYSVSLSPDGDTLAVGATTEASSAKGINGGDDAELNNGAYAAGAVYVFSRSERSEINWEQQAYIKASNTDASDRFGNSVSLSADGNTLAVGAFGERSSAKGINPGSDAELINNIHNAGATYLFIRTGTNWKQQAYIKASNTGFDRFGYSVSLSADGKTLAVGAPDEMSSATGINGGSAAEDRHDATYPGAAYVFIRSEINWEQQAYIKASNTNGYDYFGSSVSLSADGNTLAVGAIGEASTATGINGGEASEGNNDANESGATYMFIRSGVNWEQQAYIKASKTKSKDKFGSSVSLSADGETLAVGASGSSEAYVY